MTNKQIRQLRKTTMALSRACLYDGLETFLLKVAKDMKKVINDGWKHHYIYSYNLSGSAERLLWSMLVLMFGDYGTSPRTGWINDITGCIEFIEFFVSCDGQTKEGDMENGN